MRNKIADLSIKDLLSAGDKASIAATAIGQEVGLVLNTPSLIANDYSAADLCCRDYATVVADRVPLAFALQDVLGKSRLWCFRAKETLKPFLSERHSSLWRPTGFLFSLRVADDYDGLRSQVGSLAKYLAAHPEQKNDNLKVNVTATRATELHGALKDTQEALEAHDELIADKHKKQEEALEVLRKRLRGLISELEQLIPADDVRWRRFGFNIPAEPETPARPEQVQVNNNTPGQLVVSCAPVSFAVYYRCFAARVGSTSEPVPVGTSSEPLFVIETLEGGARYNVFVSAVNSSGNEGPRSEVVVAEVLAKAVA
jgi:hypothetical protein